MDGKLVPSTPCIRPRNHPKGRKTDTNKPLGRFERIPTHPYVPEPTIKLIIGIPYFRCFWQAPRRCNIIKAFEADSLPHEKKNPKSRRSSIQEGILGRGRRGAKRRRKAELCPRVRSQIQFGNEGKSSILDSRGYLGAREKIALVTQPFQGSIEGYAGIPG